jgi:hypothetical protein
MHVAPARNKQLRARLDLITRRHMRHGFPGLRKSACHVPATVDPQNDQPAVPGIAEVMWDICGQKRCVHRAKLHHAPTDQGFGLTLQDRDLLGTVVAVQRGRTAGRKDRRARGEGRRRVGMLAHHQARHHTVAPRKGRNALIFYNNPTSHIVPLFNHFAR